MRKGHHVDTLVYAAAGLTELLAEIGGVLARRDKDRCAALLGMERRGASDLADIAHRVLVCGGIPIKCLPLCGIEAGLRCGDEYGNMLCIEMVAVRAAVARPKMVVVDLSNDLCGWQTDA